MFSNYNETGTPLLTDSSVPNTATFVLDNTTSTIANTLRRCTLMETRSVGFSADLTKAENPGVVIRKNTSVIFNEMLAHRLTLLPMGVVNIDSFDPTRYECVIQVKNESTGPVSSETMRHVTASDFIVREKQDDGTFTILDSVATTKLFPRDPITKESSLLVSLQPHWNATQPPEEYDIDLTAYPVIGRGRDFMGFCPVSQCTFANTPDEDPVRREQFFNEWILAYKQKQIPDPTKLSEEERATLKAEWATMAAQRCFKVDAKGQPNSFTFTVESVGIRPVKDIVAEGIQSVIDLITPYTDTTKTMEELGMSIQQVDSRMSGINVIFNDQDHTLGNLLQTILTETYLDSEMPRSPITFAGYKIKHPLYRVMTLTLGLSEAVTDANRDAVKATIREVVTDAATRAKTIFEQLKGSWANLTNPSEGRSTAAVTPYAV